MLRYLAILGLIVVGSVIALSFYQPPMRLMPAPAKYLVEETNAFAVNRSLTPDPRIAIFYATNRLPIGPRDNRLYAVIPGRDLHTGVATIRIGDEGTTWDKIYAWSTRASDDPRPFLHLENLNEHATIESGGPLPPEAKVWFAHINEALKRSRHKDIVVYVHGANTTVERAAGQAAQFHHFTGRNSVVVLFAWPTAENFLRYLRDVVTAYGAAPHLAELIELLAENTDAVKINVSHLQCRRHCGQRRAGQGRSRREAAGAPLRPGSARSITPRPMPISAASWTVCATMPMWRSG